MENLRRVSPDIAVTTDIMAGFPGESDRLFNNTLQFLKEIRPSRMHIFPFSRRPNTLAYNLKNTVKPEIVRQRVKDLKALAGELSLAYCRRFIGRRLTVITEAPNSPKLSQGYSDNYIKVYIPKPGIAPNSIVEITASEIYQEGLLGI